MAAKPAAYFREKAAFCRSFAARARLPDVVAGLNELAAEFKAEAAASETQTGGTDRGREPTWG